MTKYNEIYKQLEEEFEKYANSYLFDNSKHDEFKQNVLNSLREKLPSSVHMEFADSPKEFCANIKLSYPYGVTSDDVLLFYCHIYENYKLGFFKELCDSLDGEFFSKEHIEKFKFMLFHGNNSEIFIEFVQFHEKGVDKTKS